ncbi:hypothetical protein AJ80_04452 [Polytolypa hystricis UAMH7299]|uniref:SPT2 chromatin protein n=1 Tax=Polytolypa hystricis (strain UAMH7299) TaxID=1447883 RepID=A0A2B7YC91_POLH7|nr:hypothetical protein AJ80_04452 [Polytolypa hystricis UAMH7299]
MSFLNSVLLSIETGDAAVTPPSVTRNPTPKPTPSVPKSAPPVAQSKPYYGSSQKRKAEDEIQPGNKPRKASRPSSPFWSSSQKSTPVPSAAARPRVTPQSTTPSATTKPSLTTAGKPLSKPAAAPPTKPPPKGSYAEMMLRAKQLQHKTPTQLGMIKHQSAPKEKISKAKRRAMEAKQREQDAGKPKRPGAPSALEGTSGRLKDGKAGAGKARAESEYKGTARPPRDPAVLEYKGTAGLASRRPGTNGSAQKQSHLQRSRSRTQDEYLGTDEEDEGDQYGDGEEEYYSDVSSDMEAGALDVETEEQEALRLARLEDERELRAELAAKKEKMERKRKLTALVSKPRR